jgi:15-cis-phytoene synthase
LLLSAHLVNQRIQAEQPALILKLGVALQLANILRDVSEDWCNRRLYLPLDGLKDFGLSEEDIAAGRNDLHWQK